MGLRSSFPSSHYHDSMVDKWPIFWDSYESAIHNNDQLTEFNSLLLRSLLECMALDAISGLTLSAVRELSGSG